MRYSPILTGATDPVARYSGVPDAPIPSNNHEDAIATFECPLSLKRRGVEMRMVVTNTAHQHRQPDPGLVQLILKAQRYLARHTDGQSITVSDVAASENVAPADISRILPIAFLSPGIVDGILAGTQPASLTVRHLCRLWDIPLSWRQQSELLAGI